MKKDNNAGNPRSVALMVAALVGVTLPFPATAMDHHQEKMEVQTGAEQSLLTIITSPDPQTQFMALTLTKAAVQKGAKAQILLCGSAGDLALVEPPAQALAPLAPKGISPQKLLRIIIDQQVRGEVCAIYLPNRTANETSLLDGVGVAAPNAMAETILIENQKLLSF